MIATISVKRRALTPARVRLLLLTGRKLAKLTPKDETAAVCAAQRVRDRRKSK